MKIALPFRSADNLVSLALLLILTALPAPSFAQNDGQAPENAGDPVDPVATPPPVAGAKPALQDLGKSLLTMKFDRSPQALLAATRAQRKGGELSPEDAFKMSVMFGDWAAVGETLAGLTPEAAAAGYARLLESLAQQSIPVGTVLKTPEPDSEDEDSYERNNRLQNERNQLKTKSTPLLSEDFYSLVDASPTDIRENHIADLTKLAETAIAEGGRRTLVAKLVTGWKGLGGTTPEGRKLATSLLSSIGWIKDAAPFLPLKKEEWEDADTTQLVFAMEYFTKTGIAERDERQLQQAAEICARLMKTARFGNYTRPQFRLAMDRLVQLLPVLEKADARKLITEQLFKQTATLTDLISIIGELGQNAAEGTDLEARSASLGTQHLILEALVTKTDRLPSNVAVMVMNWLTEAEGCYRAGGAVATEMSQADRMMMRRFGFGRDQEKKPTLSIEQISATAPPAELVSRLNPGLAQRVRLTLLKVNILRPDQADLTLLREYVKAHPGLEREVCQDVLAGWVSKRAKPSESPQVRQMRAYGMYIPPQMLHAGAGIPLTRLRQNQNIQHFKSLLAELREISPEPLDSKLIVQAFMTLHSGAEVYQLDDIMAIFGLPENMVREELLDLLDGMRARLGQQWRDPKTQQKAATNRTEQEAKDEVSRGYRTALELVKRGIRAGDGDWAPMITRGKMFYDASQYEFERGVKLTDYVDLRSEAFESFRMASELYAAKVATLPRGQWTCEPYQAWFFIMLGASDLAQLTTNAARADPGLKSIGDAMRSLPESAYDAHLEMFGKMLGDLFPRIPANARQRFLNCGLKIIGEDHPAAKTATASLNYYRELLDEIQLRLGVDGPTRVGHTQPFGVFVSLETTQQLLRESGGFSKYLQNQSARTQAQTGGQGGGPTQNLRDNFSKNIHAALDESFEVTSITFHDDSVKTINLPREGWLETPLIYLVLRAKNAAVDRIPSIQLDMDFVDQPGLVVLPVMSQVQPLDARDPTVENRPCGELALDLTMDEREWRDGKVVIEIQARGNGIIPKLEDIFECQRTGFNLEAVDGNLSLTQFVSDGKVRTPKAERNWQLTYRRKPDLRGNVLFPFPQLKAGIKPATLEYKHYQDADLVTIDSAKAAAGVKLSSHVGKGPRIPALLILLAATIAAAVWYLRRKNTATKVLAKELTAPADPTPFSTVAFLRRIRTDHAPHLSESDRGSLDAQIDEIESGYFSCGTPPGLDLPGIVGKWLGIVRRSS
jgi:hypothetical protein